MEQITPQVTDDDGDSHIPSITFVNDSTVEIVAVGEVPDQEDEYDTDSGSDMDDDDHDSYPHTTTLTRKMQEKQMDIHLRYWNNLSSEVRTRYFGSHGTADNLMEHFTKSVLDSGLSVKDITQVSMDGPNANWKVFGDLRKKSVTTMALLSSKITLPAINNIYERILVVQLNDFYSSILSDCLSSYRQFHSCETSLLRMTEWRSMRDDGKLVGIVSMDLSKAFDVIQHPLLLTKLKAHGLDEDSCALLRDYLSNRQQRVKIGDTFSSWNIVKRGVPQGSVLGPTLFHIFVNDLFYHIKRAKLDAYADDHQIYHSEKDPIALEECLCKEVEKANQWYNDNGVYVCMYNIGSCGLRVVHNSFKSGMDATGWQVSSFLSSLYYLFKDAPTRKEDLFISTGTAEARKVNKPKNKSYEVIKDCLKDPCFTATLHFFKCVAPQLQPFLSKYPTDRPMIPFLSDDLCLIIRSLIRRFIKPDQLETSADKLVKIDVADHKMHASNKRVDIGFASEKLKSTSDCKPSERQIMEFRVECKTSLMELLKKVLQNCPVSYSLVRHLSCLNPVMTATKKEDCLNKFKVLTLLLNSGRVEDKDCDTLLQQYGMLVDNIPVFENHIFADFNSSVDRVDRLFNECVAGESYTGLFEVVKLLLVLASQLWRESLASTRKWKWRT
ncbi:putative RNA-directed DNA polymerase from transposon BS [Stylophora pistillata]|uniref:Putative RNA-directed DNA polymerase from transposon BS n=1 Tax=Stylophora pistillata TaxID=50429 RepID=A0A2B4RXQ9_STYPI|nr:putative RNA-directed DNA polymerase from transposon BS [Stylophora pistillata]